MAPCERWVYVAALAAGLWSLAGCRTTRDVDLAAPQARLAQLFRFASSEKSAPSAESTAAQRPAEPVAEPERPEPAIQLASGNDRTAGAVPPAPGEPVAENTSSALSGVRLADALGAEQGGPAPPADAGALTFNQAIYNGLQTHPTIGAGLETIRQSQGDYLQSTLLPNPEFFTDIQMLPFGKAFTPTRQGGPPQQDVFITYPIDWFLFGKRAAAMTATQYAVHVTQSEFQDLVRLRVLAVSGAFFDLVEAAGLQELGRATVDNLEQVEKTTALAVEVGKRPAVELNRIRLDVLGARQELRRSQATFLTAEAALRETTGLANWPGTLMANWPLGTPLESDAATVEEAIVIAERERPDLEAARWQVAKTGADVVVQERAARPTVAPALGCTRQYQKEMAMPDANSWNANVTMSVPIFDRNQGNIAKACAAQRQAQFSYGAKVLQVQAEVRQAIAELRAAEDNAGAVADEQLELAKKVRDSIVEAYGLGGRPLIDVLDAQRNYRETYRLYITTRTAFWRALYRYRAALGAQAASHE